MQTRRRFFSWLGAVAAAAAASITGRIMVPGRKTFKRIFKRNAKNEWAEIPWDDMRPGDRVLCVGIFDAVLSQ